MCYSDIEKIEELERSKLKNQNQQKIFNIVKRYGKISLEELKTKHLMKESDLKHHLRKLVEKGILVKKEIHTNLGASEKEYENRPNLSEIDVENLLNEIKECKDNFLLPDVKKATFSIKYPDIEYSLSKYTQELYEKKEKKYKKPDRN